MHPENQRGSTEMLVVCPASKELLTNPEKSLVQQSVENMILVLKEELEKEREKRREAEKKILEQTVLCEIHSRRRSCQKDFESLRVELEDFLLKAFFIQPIQGTALDLAIPLEASDF